MEKRLKELTREAMNQISKAGMISPKMGILETRFQLKMLYKQGVIDELSRQIKKYDK